MDADGVNLPLHHCFALLGIIRGGGGGATVVIKTWLIIACSLEGYKKKKFEDLPNITSHENLMLQFVIQEKLYKLSTPKLSAS